jgi:hypothetical protein
MRVIKGPVLSGFKSSAPFLQPRFRLVAYPVGGIQMVLELIDLFNRPVRAFDLNCPTLTVTTKKTGFVGTMAKLISRLSKQRLCQVCIGLIDGLPALPDA